MPSQEDAAATMKKVPDSTNSASSKPVVVPGNMKLDEDGVPIIDPFKNNPCLEVFPTSGLECAVWL
eukprot:m.696704 g.696704  ORF g.696704 m.696704 type:complete len:66 (-) comp22895_c0_seq5:3137-3334(-)